MRCIFGSLCLRGLALIEIIQPIIETLTREAFRLDITPFREIRYLVRSAKEMRLLARQIKRTMVKAHERGNNPIRWGILCFLTGGRLRSGTVCSKNIKKINEAIHNLI